MTNYFRYFLEKFCISSLWNLKRNVANINSNGKYFSAAEKQYPWPHLPLLHKTLIWLKASPSKNKLFGPDELVDYGLEAV